MPVQKCQVNNKPGFSWGASGKCYTGKNAKKQAFAQGMAIEGPKKAAKIQAATHKRVLPKGMRNK